MDLKLIRALTVSAHSTDELVCAIDALISRIRSKKTEDAFCGLLCAKLDDIKKRLLELKSDNNAAQTRITLLQNNAIVGSEFTSSAAGDNAQGYVSVCNDMVNMLNSDSQKVKKELDWILSMPELEGYADEMRSKLSELSQADLRLKIVCVDTVGKLRETALEENTEKAPVPSASATVLQSPADFASKKVASCPPPPMPSMSAPQSIRPQMRGEAPKADSPKKRKTLFSLFGKKKAKNTVQPPRVDSVQFSAVCPERAVAGKYLPLNVIMFEDGYRKIVDEVKAQLGGNAKEVKSGYVDVVRDSVVKIILTSDDAIVEDGEEARIWNGKYIDFQFALKVPDDFRRDQILLSASVYINGILSVRLKLILDCNDTGKAVTVDRRDYCSAFVSYANDDRRQVAAIIQGMRKARPDLDIFFDVESLRSGDTWLEVLKSEIEKRDLLFLCWSLSASKSEWVDKEWRYALERKGEDSIEPIPIDTPDVCPPPPELSKKHFNDKMLFIIKTAPQLLENK